jgi:REP element-mobilizing transposase RayT
MQIQPRKSFTALGKIYFWTATIHQWFHLLADEEMKDIIVSYLQLLSREEKITMFGFVIMPSHLHFIWRQNMLNGRETPKGSFMKYTAHCFRKHLLLKNKLNPYKVDAVNKSHQIWQPDSLGIEIYSREVARQKLNYIHANPVSGKWLLAKDDISYHYSSAKFYETGIDDFGFLHNVFHLFDGD